MDEEQQSHIISEQVFGSSKKIQFVSVSPMDSLLSAVNHAHRIHLPHPSSSPLRNAKDYHGGSQRTMSIESLLHSNGQDMPTFENTTSSSKRRWHSSSIADSIDERSTKMRRRKDDAAAATTTTAIQQQQQQQRQQQHCQLSSNGGSGLRTENHQQHMTTITCLHAAVAQKSYGSEKRFLCPPPMVSIQHHQQGANNNTDAPTPVVSMAVVSENGDRPLEQKILLDENKQGSFKYLHVTGTAKAKQFYLRVSLSHNHYHSFTPSSPSPSSSSASSSNSKSSTPPLPPASPSSTTTTSVPAQPYVTFFSYPVSIISKPSKKTAKARNVSNCIVANSQISLFNRINSQTVRTKYMTIQDNKLCAKNLTWSPFDIVVLRQPVQTNVGVSDESSLAAAAAAHHHHHHHQSSTSSSSPGSGSSNSSSIPVTYGSEIMLKDSRTGFRSPPMIIRKVDKGRISLSACGPVSQMQKIALQLASTATENSDEKPLYLSASGKTMTLQQQQRSSSSSDEQQKQQQQQSSDDDNGLCNTTATWLDFAPSKLSVEKSGQDRVECVDDFLCWTIAGIAKFEYSYIEPIVETNSPPMSHQQYQTQQQSSSLLSMVSSLSSYESTAADRVTYHHHHHHQPSPPPSPPRRIVPLPMILSVDYLPQTHSVEILGKHLLQPTTVPARLFDFYLGSHGPLTIKDHHQVPLDDDVRLTLELPPAQDLLVANHDVLVTKHDGSRYLELPLVMKRHDGTVYGTGKALACDVLVNCDAGRWSVVPHVNSP